MHLQSYTWTAPQAIQGGAGKSDADGAMKWPCTDHDRLYILEGLITIVWAGMTWYLVPKNYQTAYFLTEEEKKIMAWRAEAAAAYSGGTGHYTKKDIKLGAGDITTWIHAVIQIMSVTILYGMCSFLLEKADVKLMQVLVLSFPSSSRTASTTRQRRLNTLSFLVC